MNKKILVWSIVFLILINGALALGIRPAKTDISFVPGLAQNFSFKVVNNDNKSLDVAIYAEGELKDYIRLHQTGAHLGIDEEFKEVSFSVELPPALLPGTKTAQIIVEETLPDVEVGGQAFTAKLKIAHKVNVNVPYPDRYIEANVSYKETKQDIVFNVDVMNVGRFDISSAESRLSIFDAENEVASTKTDKMGIKHGNSAGLTASLDKTSIGNGAYNLIASINYDEAVLELSRELMVGKPSIAILNYGKYLVAGRIGKASIDVKNEWNKEQRNAYAEIFISDGTKTVKEKTVSFDIAARETKKIEQFIDLREFKEGDYNAGITLYYNGDFTTREDFTIHLVSEEEYAKISEKAGKGVSIYMIAVLVVAGIFAVLLAAFLMRRKHSILSSVICLYLQCKYRVFLCRGQF